MYHHVKKLVYTVRVDEPDPKFGNMLLEQFGGANGARRGQAIFGAGVEL
jgi:Mn-containing catalase